MIDLFKKFFCRHEFDVKNSVHHKNGRVDFSCKKCGKTFNHSDWEYQIVTGMATMYKDGRMTRDMLQTFKDPHYSKKMMEHFKHSPYQPAKKDSDDDQKIS